MSSLIQPSIHSASTVDFDGYNCNGFTIGEALISSEDCDRVRVYARSLESFTSGKLTPVMNPHRIDPRFLEIMTLPTLVSAMESLLGGRVSGLQTQYFYGRPGTRGFTRHQDNFYIQAPKDSFGSAWLALGDVSVENGGLIVWPGSHNEPLMPVHPVPQATTFGQDPNANSQECELPDSYKAFDVVAPKGSVVFLHGHTVHASHQNITADRYREVLLMTYLRQGEPFRAGFSAKREEFNVYPQVLT